MGNKSPDGDSQKNIETLSANISRGSTYLSRKIYPFRLGSRYLVVFFKKKPGTPATSTQKDYYIVLEIRTPKTDGEVRPGGCELAMPSNEATTQAVVVGILVNINQIFRSQLAYAVFQAQFSSELTLPALPGTKEGSLNQRMFKP